MISSLDLNFDVLSDMVGIIVEKKNPAPKEGESLQLYIPVLMPNISQTIPSKYINFINKGTRLFLNSSECRPVCKIILKSQNYLTGFLEKNHIWKNDSALEIKSRKVENSDGFNIDVEGINSTGDTIKIDLYEKYNSYYIVGGEKVECYAPNGKFSKLLFNNDKYFDN